MAFQGNFTCNTFKTGLMNGSFNFTSGSFYLALYTNSATLNEDTTTYTGTTGEASGGNYVAGGNLLTISQAPTVGNGDTAYISFSNTSWTGAITARGALIYLLNGTTNPSVCVLDFGADKTSTATFTVQFPAVTDTSAIIRIS